MTETNLIFRLVRYWNILKCVYLIDVKNANQFSHNQEEEKAQPSQYGKDNNIDTNNNDLSLAGVLKSISDDKSYLSFN
jgi:hypothetical protein